jgi:hypothetical protein
MADKLTAAPIVMLNQSDAASCRSKTLLTSVDEDSGCTFLPTTSGEPVGVLM